MQIEYCYLDIASNETELKETITQINKYPISTLCVLPYYVKLAKTSVNNNVAISAPIDYPCGILDVKSRVSAAEALIKSGVSIIDAVVPSHYLSNRKYEKFRDDIKSLKILCDEHSVKLRYILEYRVYSYELLYRICQILLDFNVDTVIPSTGYGLDDISDNIIAAALIQKKIPEIHIVCNGNIWTAKHIDLIEKAKLSNIRVNSINAVDLIYKKFHTF